MEKISIDETYLKARSISSLSTNASGSIISYISSSTYKEKEKAVENYIAIRRTDNGDLIRKISETDTNLSSPSLTKGGDRIAYFSKKGHEHFLVIDRTDSENPLKISLPDEPYSLEWFDGNRIVFLQKEPLSEDEKKKIDSGDDGFFVDHEDRFRSLYLYDPLSGIKKITSGMQVWEFSCTGKSIAMVASSKPDESSWYTSRLYLLVPESGSLKEIYNPDWRQIARPRLSPDGSKIIFLESLMSDFGVFSGDIIGVDLKSGNKKNITENSKRSYQGLNWHGSEEFYSIYTEEGSSGLSLFQGTKEKIVWSAEGTAQPSYNPELVVTEDSYFIVYQDSSSPQEIYTGSLGKTPHKLTSENVDIRSAQQFKAEIVKWKSKDQLQCYGIFISNGPEAPLVVYVHGGPTSYSSISFVEKNYYYLLKAGYSVLMPNYRGSIGKGRKYAELNRGDMGGMDFIDILTGMDYLLESKRITTDKFYITGGSYGGFITAWAVTQTDRFKAAVGLFGISDWVSFHGSTKIHEWDPIHYNETPYSGNKYEKFSPLNYVKNVKTPILLLHGKEDPYVPLGQYLQFYRALKELSKETELIVFPREGHGFSEKEHIRRNMIETINWFEKHR